MAKETVKVDNGLEEIKLQDRDKMENKKDKKEKAKKTKDNKSNGKKEGYFRKLRNEIKLVTWPSKKSVFKYSFATVMMVVLLAAFFIGISALFDLLYGLVQGWIG